MKNDLADLQIRSNLIFLNLRLAEIDSQLIEQNNT